MPLYEFYCAECSLTYDVLRPVDRSEEGFRCRKCQKDATRRVSIFTMVRGGDGASLGCARNGGDFACGCEAGSCMMES